MYIGGQYEFGDEFGDATSTTTMEMLPFLALAIVLLLIYFSISSNKANDTSPPTTEQLGRSSWTLLHTTAAKYPVAPDKDHQKQMQQYIQLFAKFYPCSHCSKHMSEYISQRNPTVDSRDAFQRWLCEFHNDVNKKLGKPLFKCNEISSIHKRWGGNASICPTKKAVC